jgi:hypothetical protein
MFCATCGAPAQPDNRFCHQCGKPLGVPSDLPRIAMADPPRPSLGFKRRPAGIIALAIYALFWACVTGFIGVCFLTLTITVWPFFNTL